VKKDNIQVNDLRYAIMMAQNQIT